MATGTIDLTGLENGSTNNPLDTAKANLPLHMTVAAFTGIAWYNVLELNLAVYLTFRRRSGLYFWSVVSSIWGIAVHSSAFVLKLYGVVPQYGVTVTLITLGWYAMVTGQALVLYSRLHLVVGDVPRLVTAVLAMIVLNAVCMHVPMTVLTYGSNSPHWRDFVDGFRVMEKLQMSVFCVQEFAISAVYIWATLRFLGGPVWHRRHVRSVMLQLFWINVAIIAMDLAMLTMEYLGRYFLEAVMKGAIYSVKLKLEFAVLNQLMQIATSSRRRQRRAAHHHHRHHHHHQHRRLHHLDHAAASGRHAGLEGDGRPTSFRAWLKRFVPGPVATTSDDDVSDDDDNNNFISPSFFQSTNNNDDDNDEEIANSAPPPRRRHAVSPPSPPVSPRTAPQKQLRPQPQHRADQIDHHGDKISVHHEETERRQPCDVGKRKDCDDTVFPSLPRPAAQQWYAAKSMSSVPPPASEEPPSPHRLPPLPFSNRPSVSNLRRPSDGESLTSSELGFHVVG